MPYYSEETVDKVCEANDIVDVVSGYVHLKRSGNRYLGLCPFHSEKTPSFSVNRDRQLFYCFGCGTGGNVINFLQKYENLTFSETVEVLASRAGIALESAPQSQEQRRKNDRRSALIAVQTEAGKYYHRLLAGDKGKAARQYLKKRRLTSKSVSGFGLGFAGGYSDDLYRYLKEMGFEDSVLKDSGLVAFDEEKGVHDRFWNRLMFPIADANSRIIAFGGRVLGDGKPKYLNSPDTDIFDKSRTLYGLHAAKRTRQKFFILCEGYMDVISLHQAGIDNAVASLGTAFTPGHAAILKRYVKSAYLSYDSDTAGKQAALRAIPILKDAGISCRVIDMRPYKDPDELIAALGSQGYKERIDSAESSFMFRIRCMEDEYDLSDPEGKSSFSREVAKNLLDFDEEIERGYYLEAVCDRYQMSTEGLKSLVRKAAGSILTGRSMQKNERPRREDVRRAKGGIKAQKQLLLWLIEDPSLYTSVSRYLSPEDFEDEVLKKVAAGIFSQLKSSGEARPAEIISKFDNEEDSREAASVFFESLKGMEEPDEAAKKKAVQEIVIKLLSRRLEQTKDNLKNARGEEAAKLLLQFTKEKKELEKLKATDFIE